MQTGHFSEDSLDFYQDLLNEVSDKVASFSEDGESLYDFTRCLRPNGTSYGTRGTCQPPNKVAPKQDVPLRGQKDFLAGGGVSAVSKGLSSMQVVNRGRSARAKAFESGGGMAAMSKKGLSRDQVIQQGARNRAEAYKAGGGKKSGVSAERAIQQGKINRANAYKAGGGDAAVKGGKSVEEVIKQGSASLKSAYEAGGGKRKFDTTPQGYGKADVIAQGKRNLNEAFKAGGGKAARAQGLSDKEIIRRGQEALKKAYTAGGGDAARVKTSDTKEVIRRGSKALQEASKAGAGSVRGGKDILADPIGYTKRSTFEAGGGEEMLKKVSQALIESYRRRLTDKEIENIKAKIAGKGVDNLKKYYDAGGGNKALSGGKTVDEVIDQGQRLIESAKEKKRQETSRSLRGRLEKGSQTT